MRRPRRHAAIPLALTAGAFALAFAQRPGLATADTKINLHLDAGRFLGDVASMWTSTGQLGGVQAGQQVGYLLPMGPFFAAGHAFGLADWVVQRLWLGTLLALASWGVVRLLDALLPRPRGVAHLVAGAAFVLNPFVVIYANRTTVTLLAYAALPWLLLAVHRGLREPRGWRWPAAAALLVAASGGGINGAVTAWMLLGPGLLLLYEVAFGEGSWRAARAFLIRALPLILLLSLWWVVPAWIQSSYGIDFLRFTEQPGTVWGTTSLPESLRLMSFWLSYVGIGFSGRAIPYFDDAHTLLFSPPVVIATLLLPAAALAGFVWTRRWRYGPFFLGLGLVALLVMGAGFPDGTPLRHGLTFTYNHVAAVRFLRASYKAAPLLAVALACLAGVAAAEAAGRCASPSLRGLLALGGSAILVLAAWPLVTGRAQDAQVSYRAVPTAWRAAAGDLDRQLPANSRAIVLPGDLFSFYTWGGTVDPILPALSRRPVAERSEVPYADFRATDLLWTIDALVHQQRLVPGQIKRLLSLIGVRSVVSGTDDDLARSDAPPPADAASQLQSLGTPARSYGPSRRFSPSVPGPPVALPQVRRYDLPSSRGLIRVEPVASPVIVDGSAGTLADLAAFGALPGRAPLLYAGDLSPDALRQAVAAGGTVVIGDSNRRRAFAASRLEQNTGPTLTAAQGISADGLMLDPFGRGPDAQTVAVFQGIRSVESPASPQRPQFPEHAAFAALDGSPQTAWLADPTLGAGRRWLQVDFARPRDVAYVDLLPYGDSGGSVRRVSIAGRSFAIHPGSNRLALGLRDQGALRVALTDVSAPARRAVAGAGGINELRIPGLHASEELRLPTDGADALAGRPLGGVALSYLFERTTGDHPYARELAHGPYSALSVNDTSDTEQTMRRAFTLPARRSFSALGWVNVAAGASDDALDRLAGYRGSVRATSSSRFAGTPGWRASRALDGDPKTSWIGEYDASTPAWLQVSAARPVTVETLRLTSPAQAVRRPTLVRLGSPGASTGPLAVGADGVVTLPRPLRTRVLRIVILGASTPPNASAAERRAVGIAEIEGIPGLRRVVAHRFAAPCGSVRARVGGLEVPMAVEGNEAAFDAGTPLRARSCGATLSLPAGQQHLSVAPGVFLLDLLRLDSPAPSLPGASSDRAAVVLDSGTAGRGTYDRVRVRVAGPSWLVLGEGYNRGWRAWCDGHALSAPQPLDGYANGWRIGPGCREARFAFAPNGEAAIAYLLTLLGAAACLVLLGVSRWRRRGGAGGTDGASRPAAWTPAELPAGVPAARAVLAGLLIGLVAGFVFGLTAGAGAGVLLAVVLRRGLGTALLTLIAGGLLGVVVPALYLLQPGDERGGNHYSYATQHIAAHWVAVAAVVLLTAALARELSWARSRTARAARRPAGSTAA